MKSKQKKEGAIYQNPNLSVSGIQLSIMIGDPLWLSGLTRYMKLPTLEREVCILYFSNRYNRDRNDKFLFIQKLFQTVKGKHGYTCVFCKTWTVSEFTLLTV